jgi:hypothetical protein
MTIGDVLLSAMTVSIAGIAVALFRLCGPVARIAREVERLSRCASELRPHVDRLLQETEGGLAQLRQAAQRAEEILGDLQAFSGSTRQLAMPLLTRLGALIVGAKAGLGAFHRLGQAIKHGPNGRGGVR